MGKRGLRTHMYNSCHTFMTYIVSMATHCDIINAKLSSFKFSLTSKTFPSNGLHSKAEEEPES